ncbi:MAG: hypothetical protein LKI24_09670 [Acidipropionibacterium sp.]|jgi:hypothetical protein|nr:hypothetical protein [Acidipropionibacterium sp.]
MKKSMKTRLRRLATTLLVSGLMVGMTPAVSSPERWCARVPWWPTCHRLTVMTLPTGTPVA